MAHMPAPFPPAGTPREVFEALTSNPATPLKGRFYNVQHRGHGRGPGPGQHDTGAAPGAPHFEEYFQTNAQGQLEIRLFHSKPPDTAEPIAFLVLYESKVPGGGGFRRWAACRVQSFQWAPRPGGVPGHVATCTPHATDRWCGGGFGAGTWGPVSVNDMMNMQRLRAETTPVGGITLAGTGNWYMNGRNRRGHVTPPPPPAAAAAQ